MYKFINKMEFLLKKSLIYTTIYYSSLILIAVYLLKHGSVSLDQFRLNKDLIISIFFLTAGFIIYPLALKKVFEALSKNVTFKNCLIAVGSTIFSKYIPGKVAMVYSIAYRLDDKESSGIMGFSYGIIVFQVIVIISGLITGLFSVISSDDYSINLKLCSLLFVVAAIVILLSNRTFALLSKMASAILKKPIFLKPLNIRNLLSTVSVSILFWLLWGCGIYYFIDSAGYEINNRLSLIFLYPFSICVGIIMIISPGGLGVREGILSFFLIALGNKPSDAAEISILSRIWFIIGEIIIFSISMLISYIDKRKLKAEK